MLRLTTLVAIALAKSRRGHPSWPMASRPYRNTSSLKSSSMSASPAPRQMAMLGLKRNDLLHEDCQVKYMTASS